MGDLSSVRPIADLMRTSDVGDGEYKEHWNEADVWGTINFAVRTRCKKRSQLTWQRSLGDYVSSL